MHIHLYIYIYAVYRVCELICTYNKYTYIYIYMYILLYTLYIHIYTHMCSCSTVSTYTYINHCPRPIANRFAWSVLAHLSCPRAADRPAAALASGRRRTAASDGPRLRRVARLKPPGMWQEAIHNSNSRIVNSRSNSNVRKYICIYIYMYIYMTASD